MKKILCLFISMVMLVGMLPIVSFAATEIGEIVTLMSTDTVPKAGMEVTHFMPNVPDGAPYQRDWDGTEWYDENGVMIAPIIKHHYDIGYEFEAGRTYYADYQYTADEGYVFTQNPTITLTGPNPDMFTYQIVDRWDNNRSVTVRYTFTIPGEIDYPDVNKVSMMYYGLAADGNKKPEPCEVIYNNCTITREEWNTGTWSSNANWGIYEDDGSNAPTFLAGETYVHMIELTAKEGYKFASGLHVQKGTQDEEEYGVVSLSADRTVATVKFTYEIPEIEIINTVELMAANQHISFCPRSDKSIYLPQPFISKYTFAADCPYQADSAGYEWIIDETGEHMLLGYPQSFEAGKTYTLKFVVRIRDEYETTHRFANDAVLSISDYQYAKSDFVEFKMYGGGLTETVEVTFTAQFPENAGSSVDNPVVCNSFAEFKYAMENEDIRYIKLGSMDETIPKTEGEGLIPAIAVNGIKHLTLLGDSTFTAPAGDGIKTVCALLHVVQNDTLTITGSGSLKFRAVANNSYNAVIYNQGGSVIIDDGKLIGSYNTAVYGKAIWQDYGELRISGGQLFAENALAPGKLPVPKTAVNINGGQAWIQGGTFKMENVINTIDLPYGLDIGQDATVELSGGTFYGIVLPTDSTPLADYMDEDFYTPYSDGSWFNPEAVYSQEYVESGKVVKIAHVIDDVNVLIDSPVPGRGIYTKVYNVPEGSYLHTVDWYEDGEYISTAENFEAGKSYKVVISLFAEDNGMFAVPLTSATINYDSDTTYEKLGYDATKAIALTLDMGVCPNLVNEVDLTITAPKEGNKPSYTVGCGSDAYYAVGGSSNYTDYRQWYMSSDGYDWWEINQNHTFMSGYYYKVCVDIHTNNGYEFPLYDNGSSIVPGVSATVNGYNANVIKAYDQDPSSYITVEYNFGECNDSVIEEVKIVGVTEPVAGEYPTYSYSILGSGYSMNTSKNAYYDAYWKNPPEKWYYIKNGIGWFDMTEGDWVYENEKFIPGHEYQVNVYLKADDGYEFYHDKWYDMLISATVNGNEAGFDNSGSDCAINQKITYTFSCKQQEVSTLILYLDAPEAGKTPSDYKVESAYPELYAPDENYAFDGIYWYDCEGNMLSEDDEFIQGMQYKVEIKVVPTKVSGVNMCKFVSPVNVMLNGNTLSEYGDWDAIYGSSNAVYIYYTFRKAAQAPEVAVDPIEIYRSGNNCIVKLNEAEEGVTYIAAAYNGEFLVKAVTLSLGEAVTLTGDTVKVLCWNKGKLEPVCEAVYSGNE